MCVLPAPRQYHREKGKKKTKMKKNDKAEDKLWRPHTHTHTLKKTGDVGGQKTLRSYWRNYFEKTDCLIWVVDSTDRFRLDDCAEELHGLLQEERLLGASLLVFANKSEVVGSMGVEEIRTVRYTPLSGGCLECGETNFFSPRGGGFGKMY